MIGRDPLLSMEANLFYSKSPIVNVSYIGMSATATPWLVLDPTPGYTEHSLTLGFSEPGTKQDSKEHGQHP